MKKDSESPLHSKHPPSEYDSKENFQTENPFILAAQNHVIINALKEQKNDALSSSYGRKNTKVNDSRKCQHVEDCNNTENGDDTSIPVFGSPHAHEFEVALKEGINSSLTFTKENFCECKTVKDISVDKEVQTSVNKVKSSVCNHLFENEYENRTREMTRSSASYKTTQSSFDSYDDVENKGEVDVTDSDLSKEQDDSSIFDNSGVKGKLETARIALKNDSESRTEENHCFNKSDSEWMLNIGESASLNQSVDDSEISLCTSDKGMVYLSEMDSSALLFCNDQAKSEEHDPAFTAVVGSIQESTHVLVKDDIEGGVISFSFTKEEKPRGRNEIEEDTNTSSAQNYNDNESTSAICSFCRLIENDWNSADRESSSGAVVNQEHILYSGSISFRSESSATSTRSFAFPVLQSQWNSSPVRMKKVKRKRWHWRVGLLLCCRF